MKKTSPFKEDYASPESRIMLLLSYEPICASGGADNFVVDPDDDIEF